MKKIYLPMLSIGVAFLMSSCYYDNFKELRPQGAIPTPCDSTGVVSYSLQIKPLLSANCAQSCHNGVGSGSRDLTGADFAQIQSATTNGANAGDGGSLYGTVSWDPNYGNNMPKNGSKMSDCDIAKIRKWAAAGGPNN